MELQRYTHIHTGDLTSLIDSASAKRRLAGLVRLRGRWHLSYYIRVQEAPASVGRVRQQAEVASLHFKTLGKRHATISFDTKIPVECLKQKIEKEKDEF